MKYIALTIIMLAFCGVALARGYATVKSSFSTEYFSSRPSSITYENGNLWIGDSTNSTFYKTTTNGSLISSFTVGTFSSPYGLCWDGSAFRLHASSGISRNLYQMNTSGSIISIFAGCISYPYASDSECLSGANPGIWIASAYSDRKVYRHNSTSGSIISSFTTNAFYPCGLAYDGSYLVIMGDRDGKIYCYSTSGTQVNYCYPPFTASDYAGGVVYVGGDFYWSVSQQARVYRINIDWNPQSVEANSLGRIRSFYK